MATKAKTIRITLDITRASYYPVDGNLVLSTSPCDQNKSGVWRLSKGQAFRFASTGGVTPMQVPIVKGTLVIDGKDVKAGEEYTDRKTGEVGVYTKDHFRVEEHSLVISQAAQLMVLAAAQMQNMFTTPATPTVTNTSLPDDTEETEEVDETEDIKATPPVVTAEP